MSKQKNEFEILINIQNEVFDYSDDYLTIPSNIPELESSFCKWARKQKSVPKDFWYTSSSISESDIDELILPGYARLLIKINENKSNYFLSKMDHVQESFFGLYKAIKTYNYIYGFSFKTYANYKIRSQLSLSYNDYRNLIKLPSRIYIKLRKYENESLMSNENQYRELLKLKNNEFHEMRNFHTLKYVDYISFEQLWAYKSGHTNYSFCFPWMISDLMDKETEKIHFREEKLKNTDVLYEELEILTDIQEADSDELSTTEDVFEEVFLESLRNEFLVLFEKLSLREETIIQLKIGWDDGSTMTFKRIAQLMGMSVQGVRNAYDRGISKLKKEAIRKELHEFF